jgi:tRNA (adenine22-N1)-methyltransferase
MKQLSPRLAQLAELFPSNATVIDVGCDHGWLPIFSLRNGLIREAIAVDRASAPLAQAKDNAHGMEDISFVQSDGLDGVDVPCGAVVSIAGMGGQQICSIIRRAPLDRITRFVLQPNREAHRVRALLEEVGWRTSQASVVEENGRFFLSWKAEPIATEQKGENRWHWEEEWFLEHPSQVWKEWLHQRVEQIKKSIRQAERFSNSTPDSLLKENTAILEILSGRRR